MSSRKVTLTPLQLSINSSETLTLKVIFKLSQISTQQQISRQELNNITLKNSLGIISGKLEFRLNQDIDLKDYKINFDIINLKGKDVRFVGNGQQGLSNWKNTNQLIVQRCWDKQAKLKLVIEIQELVVKRPRNKMINTTYEIGRKDQVINTLLKKKVEQIWRNSKGGEGLKQVSGSYKKRFQYENVKLSRRSPSPRIKTPQPIRKIQTPRKSKQPNNQNQTNESIISQESRRLPIRQQKQSSKKNSSLSRDNNYQKLTQKLQWIENQLKEKHKSSIRQGSNTNQQKFQCKDYAESNKADIQNILSFAYITQGASSPTEINFEQLQCKISSVIQTIGQAIKNQSQSLIDNIETGQHAENSPQLQVNDLLRPSNRQSFREAIEMLHHSGQNQQALLTQIQTLKQSLQSFKFTNGQLQAQLYEAKNDYKIKIQALSNDYNRELTQKGIENVKLMKQLQSTRESNKQIEQQAERNRNLIQKLTRLYEGDQQKEKKWEEVLGNLQKRLREVNYENQDLKEHRKLSQGRSKQPDSMHKDSYFIHNNNYSQGTLNRQLFSLKSKVINLQSHVKMKEHQLSYMRLKMDSLKQQNTDLQQEISNLTSNNYRKYYNQLQNSSSLGKLHRSTNIQLENLKGENSFLKEQVQILKQQVSRLNQTLCQSSALKCRNLFDLGKENAALDQRADVSQDLLKKKKAKFEELLNIAPKRQIQKPNSTTNH